MHTSIMMAVNSSPAPHRHVAGTNTSTYRPHNEDTYSQIHRCTEKQVQPEIESDRKKDKKWSIGKLFRRKKKDDESGSSSESDEGVSTASPKKKSRKKKRAPPVNNFDHIVIRDTRRAQSLAKPHIHNIVDDGVLSDPSAGFVNYRAKTQMSQVLKEPTNKMDDFNKSGRHNTETQSKKTRKGRLKARVEALRNSLKADSSSDEESLKSSNSSSLVRFRSEDSLMRSRDSSLNKKSRSARNERYIKRLSRDDENQLNKEAELLQQGYTKTEVEMLTRTPTSQSSGYGTCKRDQSNKFKPEVLYSNDSCQKPMKSESVSTFASSQNYLSSINFNAKVNNEHINYSIQCPVSNSNREPNYANNNVEKNIINEYENTDVLCVKFPLRNATAVKKEEKSPPVPPPRDMQRKIATPISMYYENSPLVTERISGNQNLTYGVPNNDFERIMRRSQERSLSYGHNGLRRPLSNSEDHIAMQNNDYRQNFQYKIEQPRRPASVSAEPNHYGICANTPLWRKRIDQNNDAHILRPDPVQLRQDYLYYADQSPRSRRPISIKSSQNGFENQYLSDSQTSLNINGSVYRKPRNSSDFWKKIDDAEKLRRQHSVPNNHVVSSNGYTSYSNLYNQDKTKPDQNINKNANIQNRSIDHQSRHIIDGSNVWKATTEYKRSNTVEPPRTVNLPVSKTHTRHKSDTFVSTTYQMPSDDEKSSERRKSTNLDDALNELEAIYNSLGLGDEDLLDRAERRELMTPKINDSHFNDWNGNDNEIQLRSQPSTPIKRVPRRSTLPDKLQDDMAFRRMNSLSKEKPNYKESQGQISYMLASPVYVPYTPDDDRNIDRNEPDIVHDDVVYRNIKQTNNRLKTLDPQPPFGIPVGPVSPAPQSDYLHATPENKTRSRFVPRKSPDLVSDDLAYRSLRKDNRHSSLFSSDDYTGSVNNNQTYTEFPLTKDSITNLKKRRAVRSLSANIFTMIQKEIDEALNMSKLATLQKTQSNSDVMKRLRGTYENNDNEQVYPRNKVKQRHNTVSLFVNNFHTPSHHFAKDDSFIHPDDKHSAKPSACDKSKSSSPSNRSPPTSKRASKDDFQHVLTMLAQEAMDTSNKLGVALAELDKNRNNTEKRSDIQGKISDSRSNFLNGLTSKSIERNETEMKNGKIQFDVFNNRNTNKLQPGIQTCATNSNKTILDVNKHSKGQKTEDSLLAISNQLHKVEDKLKYNIDKEIKNDYEKLKLCNYVLQCDNQEKGQVTLEPKSENELNAETVKNTNNTVTKVSLNSYVNEMPTEKMSSNPFLDSDSKIKEINEINAFKELKDGISDLIAGISHVNDKLSIPKPLQNLQNYNISNDKITGISEATEKLNEVTQEIDIIKMPCRASANLSIYENDLDIKKEATDSTEYNSSEELATIFKLKSESLNENENDSEAENNSRGDLSSPKLVYSMNEQLRRHSVDGHSDDCATSQNNAVSNNRAPWRAKNQSHNSQKENRGEN